jgi:molybdate transport system ATP-binding protein
VTLDFDLRVARGEFRLEAAATVPIPGVVALFGRSGSGKSTLAHAIAGLGPRPTGHLRLESVTWLHSSRSVHVPAERRGVGYVFQDARLFPHYDVIGNLRYGARRARGSAAYAREDELVALLGLELLLGRRVHELSGGERQRVALGRALLAQPRLLVLDEPLASLDDARREEVLPYLERVRDRFGVPMVYVSHRYDEVLRLATHVLLLDAGRVVASGPPAALGRDAQLRSIVGSDAVGAVLDATIEAVDARARLATVRVGSQTLQLPVPGADVGAHVRLQIPARDVVLAVETPRGLSVRTELRGVVAEIVRDDEHAALVAVDCEGVALFARVTHAAVADLALAPGRPVWALVKAAALRGHVYRRP